MSSNTYSEEFIESFKHLCKNLDDIDLCRLLNINGSKLKEIRQEVLDEQEEVKE